MGGGEIAANRMSLVRHKNHTGAMKNRISGSRNFIVAGL